MTIDLSDQRDIASLQEIEIGTKVEDLSPKTKVQEYCKLQFDELLAILKKNKRKLVIDPARRSRRSGCGWSSMHLWASFSR